MKKERRELIELYLQDKCSEDQLQEILQLVETDPEFRKELAEAGRIQGLLFAVANENYEGLNNRVQKSVGDMEPDSLELQILDKIQETKQEVKSNSKTWSYVLWAAIAAQIAIVFFLMNRPDDKFLPETLASLYSESGKAVLERNGKKMQVTADLRLIDGDKIYVEEKGDLRITWNDSTITEFKDESQASFSIVNGAKHIFVDNGKLMANVTKQPEGKPLVVNSKSSVATVLGTKFTMKINQLESMLEVKRGSVELMRKSDSKSVVVNAHEYAVSSPNQKLEVAKSNNAVYRSHEINNDTKDRKVEIVAEINGSRKLYLVVDYGRDGRAFDHAGWLSPRLEDSLGRQVSLLDLQWTFAESEWGVMGIGIDALGKKLTHNKVYYPNGIGTHAMSIIEYDIPEGYRLFKATGVITDSGWTQKRSLSSVVFEVYTDFPEQRYKRLMLNKKEK